MRRLSSEVAGWAVGIALVALLLWLRPLLNASGIGQVPHENPGPTQTATAAPTPSQAPIPTPSPTPRPPTPEPTPIPAGPVLGTGDYPQTVKPGTTPVPDPDETQVFGLFGQQLTANQITITISRLPPDTAPGQCFANGIDAGKELIGYRMTGTWSGFTMWFPHLWIREQPVGTGYPVCFDPEDGSLSGEFISGKPYRIWWALPEGVASAAEVGFGFMHNHAGSTTWFFLH